MIQKVHTIGLRLAEVAAKKMSLTHEEYAQLSTEMEQIEVFVKSCSDDEFSKLKGDYNKLLADYENIKSNLEEAIRKISLLEAEVFNTKIANKLADVFSYFRDYIIRVERKEQREKYLDLQLKDSNDILEALSPPAPSRADTDEEKARKEQLLANSEAAKRLVENLSLSPDVVTNLLLSLKRLRNDSMHFVDKNQYGSQVYMDNFLKDVLTDLNSMTSIHAYHGKKNEISNFVEMLIQLVPHYSD